VYLKLLHQSSEEEKGASGGLPVTLNPQIWSGGVDVSVVCLTSFKRVEGTQSDPGHLKTSE
jgi:hypothetical protein